MFPEEEEPIRGIEGTEGGGRKCTWAEPKYHRAWTSWCKARQRVRWSRSPVTTFTRPAGNKVIMS